MMKKAVSYILLLLGGIVAFPFGALAWLEKHLLPSDALFHFGAHFVSLFPGIPGNFVRRVFYMMSLDHFHRSATVSFGSYFSDRHAHMDEGAGMGAYCVIGLAEIGPRVRIASHVSVISGLHEHGNSADIGELEGKPSEKKCIKIGAECWIGEGATIAADVGKGSIVGVGSVVVSRIPEYSMAMGNPARLLPTAKQPKPAGKG